MSENPEVRAVMAVLDRYFDALENGMADSIMPSPVYQWQFWKDGLTVERMRRGLEGIDDYLNADSQHNWAEANYPGGKVKFDKGPDLNRLPDPALVAMFMELDSVLAAGETDTKPKPQDDERDYNLGGSPPASSEQHEQD